MWIGQSVKKENRPKLAVSIEHNAANTMKRTANPDVPRKSITACPGFPQ
jgi:hypothetical protein